MMSGNTFPKSARLKSRKKLQEVFKEGKTVRTPCLRLTYLTQPSTDFKVQCAVGSVTRNFKKAVDRNRIKRLLREAYRQQQQQLITYPAQVHINLAVFILYTGKELPDYKYVYENVALALQKLQKGLDATCSKNT